MSPDSMHKIFLSKTPWLTSILPEGFKIGSSLLISGPGGSGKPIIAYDIAREWLQTGNSIILFLTSTTYEYTNTIFKVLGADLDEYKTKNQVFIVEFDPKTESPLDIDEHTVKINFLKPEHWEYALKTGKERLHEGPNGVLFVASALNLLYFSPTYREKIHEYLLSKLQTGEENATILWTVNSQAYKSYIDILEETADVLMISLMDKETVSLYVHVVHAKDIAFSKEKVKVPVTKDIIKMLKQEAEAGRTHLIPILKKI